jgi:hypothetical protein
MSAFEEAVEAKKQAEDLRLAAIDDLLKQRAVVDEQLAGLGYKREYKKKKAQ